MNRKRVWACISRGNEKNIIHDTESLRIRLSLIYAGKSYKGNC